MFLKKSVSSILLVLCFIHLIFAQNALLKINVEEMKQHLGFIASDSLQGRQLGTETDGLGITANYLADYSIKIGLKSGAENYFQKVNLVQNTPGKNNSIEIRNKKTNRFIVQIQLLNLADNQVLSRTKKL